MSSSLAACVGGGSGNASSAARPSSCSMIDSRLLWTRSYAGLREPATSVLHIETHSMAACGYDRAMTPLERAIFFARGQAKLARAIGANPKMIGKWRRARVPDRWCPAIEAATYGVVTVEELRPDVTWQRNKDEEWPYHECGRPSVG